MRNVAELGLLYLLIYERTKVSPSNDVMAVGAEMARLDEMVAGVNVTINGM